MEKKYDVLAIGELNVDLILTGMATLPIPGREIIADNCALTMGSSTAICAAGIAKLGLKTGFVGKVGDDSYGRVASDALRGYGVDLQNLIVDPSIDTGITVSMTARNNSDRALLTYLGSIDSLKAEEVSDDILAQTKHIHVGSFFLQSKLRPGLADMFARAKKFGVTTSLDAGWDDTGCWDYGILDVLKHTDVFLPNESEALNITGKTDVAEAAKQLSTYCKICAVKCGADGAAVACGGEVRSFATYKATPVDTTGAGDSFNAGFIYGFVNGLDIEGSAQMGNACGSVSITRYGGASSCASLDDARGVILNGKV